MRQHGPWWICSSREVYRDPWISVRRDEVIRPDAQPGTYCVVTLKPGVCVVAVDEEQYVYLTEEFHYGVGRTTLEAVSGGCEPGEDPQETAQRELQEELGIVAQQWTSLGTVDPFTANVVSPTSLFLARGLRVGPQEPEGTEVIRRVRMPLLDAIRCVMTSQITHGPTVALLLKLHVMLTSDR